MMNDVAMAAMEMSSARLATQYAMKLQKNVMSDMEQQAMGELAMLPPTPASEIISTPTPERTRPEPNGPRSCFLKEEAFPLRAGGGP